MEQPIDKHNHLDKSPENYHEWLKGQFPKDYILYDAIHITLWNEKVIQIKID